MDATVLFDLSYGVCVIGTKDGQRPVGCIANTIFQVTAEPMTVGVSVSKANFTEHCIRENGMFTVSILSENTPQEVIGTFGFHTSKDTDKFSLVNTVITKEGMPVVDEKTVSYFTCRVLKEMDMLTHTIFVGEVVEAEKLNQEAPMTYAYYHKVKKGKTAKNAPTYQKESPAAEEERPVYICSVCNYQFAGTEEEFLALPEDWVCPVCGMPKEKFQRREPGKAGEKQYICDICGYIFDGTEEEFLSLPADWRCPVCGVDKEKFSVKTKED